MSRIVLAVVVAGLMVGCGQLPGYQNSGAVQAAAPEPVANKPPQPVVYVIHHETPQPLVVNQPVVVKKEVEKEVVYVYDRPRRERVRVVHHHHGPSLGPVFRGVFGGPCRPRRPAWRPPSPPRHNPGPPRRGGGGGQGERGRGERGGGERGGRKRGGDNSPGRPQGPNKTKGGGSNQVAALFQPGNGR